MASGVQRSWRFSNFLLVVLWVLLGMVRLSHGSVSYFKPSKWTLAHATFYGDEWMILLLLQWVHILQR